MNANPLDSEKAFGATTAPQSPFQAPLFVKDRYGSVDSTSTLNDNVEPANMKDDMDGVTNPWAGDSEKKVEKSEEQSADGEKKTWSAMVGRLFIVWGGCCMGGRRKENGGSGQVSSMPDNA